MADNKKRGLGRGLDLLFTDNAVNENNITELKLTEIEPNKNQPRKQFDDAALQELADSIRQYGLLQPITVRPMSNLSYQIVAGERRWRASRLAGLETVPVIIREMSDIECMEIAMIENLQREDLNPVEEALGYKQLLESFDMTQEQVAQAVGKSRSAVANSLRLLALGEDLLALLQDGKITSGHARALLAIEDISEREAAAQLAVNGATVRDIEKLSSKRSAAVKKQPQVPVFYKEAELALTEQLGNKIKVSGANGKGSVTIDFYSDDELRYIVNKLCEK